MASIARRGLTILLLRLQGTSLIRPGLRRLMLNLAGADIHPTAIVERGCHLGSKLRMGPGTILNAYAFVDGSEWLVLEEGARVAVRATIITKTHAVGSDPNRRSDHSRNTVLQVVIGQGSWVGAGCTILPGCDIAPGCVIAAGTVVSRPTEPNGLYVGGGGMRRVKALPA
ncbi:acyltransferase [Sphingomonas sp. UYP23]